MPRNRAKQFTVAEDWAVLGLPAIASILAPWQNKITSMELISDYFQPNASIAASVLGPLTCFVAYAVYVRRPIYKEQHVAIISCVACFLFVFICWTIKNNDGQIVLTGLAQALFRIAWQLCYILIFVSFGISAIIAFLAVRKQI